MHSRSHHPPARKAGALARLTRACAIHPWRTMAVWAAVIATIAVSASLFGGKLVNEFSIPGSEAQRAVDLLEKRFPERAGDSAQIVFASDQGLKSASAKADIDAARQAAAKIPGVDGVGDPYAGKAGGISKDGTIGFVDVQFDKPAAEVDEKYVTQLQDDVRAAVGKTSLDVEFGGAVMDSVQPDSHTSEVLGMAAAMIVLLVVFGTAVAMAVPLTLALISVGIGLSLLTLAAALTDFNKVTPILAVMIGLGVGIDYALFIVTRFRQELADGASPAEAAVTAASTAGRAVIFAGLTVAISISGLAVVGIPFVTKLGLGAAMTVIGAVMTAVTLLPAILAKLGHRIDRLAVPFIGRERPANAAKPSVFARWGRLVTSHPKVAIVVTLAAILAMAAPAMDQRLGTADDGTNPASTTTRKAYDLLAKGFGPGSNGPLLVAVDQKGDPGAANRLAAAFQSTPGVAAVVTPLVNESGDTAQIPVILTTSPQSVETSDKLHELRDTVVPQALAGSTAKAYIGGTTASYEDIATKIGDRMPLFLLYVVGITFLILTMAFRSIVVATKAAATTMLSAFAAFGALTAVFEWGWMNSLIGLDVTGPTESFIPMMVLSILFGLSMDYEVFLVSRIREEYVRTGDARGSVRAGVGAIGKVIVAAGIIMGVVFWAFVLGDDRTIKAFGVGLGVAILTDALLVRMTLVPAIMHLLGDRAWYMPRWLGRLLPHITIEPTEEPDEAYDVPPAALPQTA
jgi:putative drug exporter of the RND superfamily